MPNVISNFRFAGLVKSWPIRLIVDVVYFKYRFFFFINDRQGKNVKDRSALYVCFNFFKVKFSEYVLYTIQIHIHIHRCIATYIYVYLARECFKDLIGFLTILYMPTTNSERRVGILILDPRHIYLMTYSIYVYSELCQQLL